VPKLTKHINNFSGGLNNNTNSKDLNDNEFQILDKLSNEVPGKITMNGSAVAENIGSNAISSIDDLNFGNGLLYTNLDRNLGAAQTISETEYFFINDTTNSIVRIYDITTPAVESNTINYGASSSKVDMYTIDGQTRVVPHYGASDNKAKVLGYYKFNRKLGASSTNQDINNEVTATYRDEDLYLAPIQRSGSYNYDKDALNSKQAFFNPTQESELFMWDIQNGDFSGDTRKLSLTAPTVENILDNYGSGTEYTVAKQGSMAIFAYTRNDDLDDSNGNITFYADKRYGIWATKVYANYDNDSNKSESHPVYLGEIYQKTRSTDKVQPLHLALIGRMGDKSPRYAGFKLYYALMDNWYTSGSPNYIDSASNIGVKYLLAEVDFEKGLRFGGSTSYEAFDTDIFDSQEQFIYPNSAYSTVPVDNVLSGRTVANLSIKEPLLQEKGSVIGDFNTGFKTSTIINRRVYAGNIQYKDSKNNLVTKSDRVLKSLPNKFDFFPEDSFIDVEVEDGDSVIKLESIGNKLLQFKRNKLFIVNVSRDIEFLEATIDYKGVEKDYHVVKGEGFVAWFNTYGAYLYDGERINELSIGGNGQPKLANWSSDYYHDDNIIGYLPISKELIILKKGGNSLYYDLKSESWRTDGIKLTIDATNFVNDSSGQLKWFHKVLGINGNPNSINRTKWNPSESSISGSPTIFKTKLYDMDTPNTSKNFNTIYINYKGGTNGANVTMKGFGTRKDNTDLGVTTIGALESTGSTFKTAKLPLPSSFKNLLSMGIQLDVTNGLNVGFEINDIQIVYRTKVNS